MPTDKTTVKVSLETFNEIANALEATGKTINKDSDITLTKDIAIKGPVDYRQVTIRKDILEFVRDVYRSPLDADGNQTSDSSHFINFFDDVYNYCLKGEKPEAKPTNETAEINKPAKTSWGKK